MVKLTLADVKAGKAIPQRGDMVGNLLYLGKDSSDLADYRLLDSAGQNTGAPLTGSNYDHSENFHAPVMGGYNADLSQSTPPSGQLSGVKMLTPDIPGTSPLSLVQANASYPPDVGRAAPPASGALIDSQYAQDMNNRFQKSLLNANVAQLGQLTVPLVNGRMVTRGNYGISRGTYKGHLYPFDIDPTFNPGVATALTKAIQQMNKEGITPTITAGFRSAKEQQWLRDHPGKYPVAKGPSWHQAGDAVAFDSNINPKTYARIVEIMQQNGFTPGNQFSTADRVHFQYARKGTNPTLEQMREVGGD